ncbi:MAG: RimK family alpha-L-glutamate ligase [Eubacterium sp.]|nr:RimK family alpha-L-glutamate ligase [Eubacterium sp.]
MKGILAVNHFLNTEKFNELHSVLVSFAKKEGIELEIKTNLELATETAACDFVLFWDKDINLARRLEKEGLPVFNSASSIEKCDDKARTYIELLDAVPQPETIIAPKTYFKADFSEFAEKAVQKLGLPVVFKECFGSFGEQVFLCNSMEEILEHITEKPFILQKFIGSSSGHDKRLEIVGGSVVAAMERTNENDFRSNITNGGSMKPCVPTEREIKLAETACEKLGLHFGGVDILDGGLVCEVNSNAHIINIMKCTDIDIASLIFKEIKRNL